MRGFRGALCARSPFTHTYSFYVCHLFPVIIFALIVSFLFLVCLFVCGPCCANCHFFL